MQLLTRNTTGKLIIELERQHVSAFYVPGKMAHCMRIVTQGSANKLDFVDTADLAAKLVSTTRVLGLRSPLNATICLPRSVACIHVLELPHVSPRDLASAVNLEMENVYGEECAQYVWDFVHIASDEKTPQYAIVFCIPKRILDGLRDALKQSQIAVERITLSELGYGPVCLPHQGLVHLLALRQNRLDVMICFRGTVIQSQTFHVRSDSACEFDRFNGTLRRLHASLPESLQLLIPKTMLLLAHADATEQPVAACEFESSLITACQAHEFTIEEFYVEELFDVARRPQLKLDLGNPRKPPAPPISRRRQAQILVAMVIMAGLIFWAFNQWELARLTTQVKNAQQKIANHEKKMTAMNSQLESAALLDQWDQSSVNWSEQISAVSRQFSENDECYVVRLQMDNQNSLERKPVSRIEGRGKSTEKILQLTRKLSADNPSLAVQPNGIESNTVDPEFSSQFRIEISEAVNQVLMPTEQSSEKD